MDRARVERIVERVRSIPEGYVRTYGDIDPRAPRLVEEDVGQVVEREVGQVPEQREARRRRQAYLARVEGRPEEAGAALDRATTIGRRDARAAPGSGAALARSCPSSRVR